MFFKLWAVLFEIHALYLILYVMSSSYIFTSSYEDFRKLGRRSLMYTERQRCILVEVYKCLNHISPPYLYDMFNVNVVNVVFVMIA